MRHSTVPGPTSAYAIDALRWQVAPNFALNIPELSLPQGKTTLLLGPSASGKSTLLRLLGRVENDYFPPVHPRDALGKIWLRPTPSDAPLDLLALTERQLMRQKIRGLKVGIVFQREGLFVDLSVLQNVAWPLQAHGMAPDAARARALELLEQVELSPDRTVAALSGGERKRLALARALGPRPPVLLLDEPFTGLDPRALDELLTLTERLIAESEDGLTVVIVTHQREDIERLGQYVVMLAGGQLARAGTREDMDETLTAFMAGEEVWR